MINKKGVFTAIAVTVLGAGTLSATTAFAQSNSTDTQDPMASVVQKLADKFNLNKDEVQAVFDETRNEQHAKMEANFESQLAQYVKDGKITEDQKALILAKHKEIAAQRQTDKDSFANLTQDERKAKMEQKRTELEAWAKEKGIDLQYLMPMGMKGHGGGDKKFFIMKDTGQKDAAPTTAQ